MSNTFNIEKAVLASVLNGEIDAELNRNHFTTLFHMKIVDGINRLKDLDKSIDFELLRNSYTRVSKWTYEDDNMLTELMTTVMPFSSQTVFNDYMSTLRDSYLNRLSLRIAS